MRFRSICKMLLILSSLFYSVSIVAQQQDEVVNKDSIVVNPPINVETLIGSEVEELPLICSLTRSFRVYLK